MSIKVAIAENDNIANQILLTQLKKYAQIEIVAALTNGEQLLEAMEERIIEAVFLDIEMPGLNGLSAAEIIKERYPDMLIVFVTAHSQYAAESYRLDATDYLVKPITVDNITRAIKKLEKALSISQGGDAPQNEKDQIIIKHHREVYFINLADIIFIEKESRKTIFHTVNGKYFSSNPLHVLSTQLGDNYFRCHKGFIVNIRKIEKITPLADRLYEVTFYHYPLKVTIRRHKFEELMTLFSQKLD